MGNGLPPGFMVFTPYKTPFTPQTSLMVLWENGLMVLVGSKWETTWNTCLQATWRQTTGVQQRGLCLAGRIMLHPHAHTPAGGLFQVSFGEQSIICVLIHIYIYIHLCISVYICTHVYTTHVYIHMYTHVYIYIYMHTHIYRHMYTCVYTYIYIHAH